MSRKAPQFAALILVCIAGTMTATAGDRFGIGVKAGSYGLGFDFGVTVVDHVAFRVSLQRVDASGSLDVDDIEYDADVTLGGEGVLADIYPMGGQFRLSVGLFRNRNQFDLAVTPTEPIEIGGTTYPPPVVGTLSGIVDFDDTAPYLGLGWGNISRGKKRLRFTVDLGVIRQGSGKIEDLNSSTGLVSQEDLAKEAEKIEDEIADYDLWPIVNVGLGIRF